MSTTKGSKRNSKSKSNERGRQKKAGPDSLEKKHSKRTNPGTRSRQEKPTERNSRSEEQAKEDAKTEKQLKKSPRTTVRERLPKVLVAMMKKANTGSCPHAKLLLDFADAENLPDAKEQQESNTLAELLLKELES
jgi:hypothetical protein